MTKNNNEDVTSVRFHFMEKNIEEIKLTLQNVLTELKGHDEKFVRVDVYLEEKKKREILEKKVEGINLKIASWSGSVIILAFIAQQIADKIWK